MRNFRHTDRQTGLRYYNIDDTADRRAKEALNSLEPVHFKFPHTDFLTFLPNYNQFPIWPHMTMKIVRLLNIAPT